MLGSQGVTGRETRELVMILRGWQVSLLKGQDDTVVQASYRRLGAKVVRVLGSQGVTGRETREP